MFAYDFVRHAYVAGTLIALACGLTGYFVVLRGQVFAGDALSHVAFTGPVAAVAIGVDARAGLFAATIAVAALLALLGRRAATGVDDVTIGIVFAWILGLGIFFIALADSGASGGDAVSAARTLFGSIFGLDTAATWLAVIIGALAGVIVLLIARPLLFATIDSETARASGVPVGALSLVFLVVLGGVAAEATQAVGALLLLGLLAAPAGAAHRVTARPWQGLALSAAIAVGAMWIGLALSYAVASLPPSTAIVLTATAAYVLAGTAQALPAGRRPSVRAVRGATRRVSGWRAPR
jgi:zinc/manganese transport system permease protein